MMTREGSIKIVTFMTAGGGALMLGHGHISHYCEYVLPSSLSMYSKLLLYKGITIHVLLSYTTVAFYFFYDVAVDMPI